MKHTVTLLTALLLAPLATLLGADAPDRSTPAAQPEPHSSPGDDDRSELAALFAAVANGGGNVTIPAGDYYLDGADPIPLSSHTTVTAYGARFHFPKQLGDQAGNRMLRGCGSRRLAGCA